MADCPSCGTSLEEDFGIVNCKGCEKVCFVDLEGNVEVQESNNEPPSEVIIDEEILEVEDEPLAPVLENLEPETFEEIQEIVEVETSTDSDPDLEPEMDFQIVLEEAKELMEEEPESSEELATQEDFVSDLEPFDSVEDEDSPIEEKVLGPVSGSEFLEELRAFSANRELTDLENSLFFDVYISRVELTETKNTLFDLLSDSRLDLQPDSFDDHFSEGTLHLKQVPYLRVVALYKRILALGLDVRWVQVEVHELDVETQEEEIENEQIEEQY